MYYLNKKDLTKAENALRTTLDLSPGSNMTKYNLGLLLKNTKREKEAKVIFESLLGTEIEKKFPLRVKLEEVSR